MGIFSSIQNLGIIKVSKIENFEKPNYIQYLDYVDVVKHIKIGDDKASFLGNEVSKRIVLENLVDDGFIDSPQSTNFENMVSMSLVLKKELIDFKEVKLDLNPSDDAQQVVAEYLLKEAIGKIRILANENSANAERIFDFEKSIENDLIFSRKIISKIMNASNYIASTTRRGPADFIIASDKMMNIIRFAFKPSFYAYRLDSYSEMFNFKMIVCNDLGDEIIVGRLGSDNELGLRLSSNDEALENNLIFNETDISGITIKYALDSYSPSDKLNYISLKAK